MAAPRRIAIIQGHPDPAGGRLCHALADAYAEGAAAGGHDIHRVEVAALDFPLLRSAQDFEKGGTPDDIAKAQESIAWANHLVFVYPLWLGTMPALLKGFLEQTFRPGFAFAYEESGWPKKKLKGHSARVIVTMGMPALAYRLFYFAHGLRNLERNILHFTGIKPVRNNLVGMVDKLGAEGVARWTEKIRARGRRGV